MTGRVKILPGVPSAEIRAEPEKLRQARVNELGRQVRGLSLAQMAIPWKRSIHQKKSILRIRLTEAVCHERRRRDSIVRCVSGRAIPFQDAAADPADRLLA